MRTAVLLAALVMIAGCSQLPAGKPGPTELTPITPSRTGGATATTPTDITTSPSASIRAPGPTASAAEAIAWVEAGPPVDGADFQVALRNGTATSLGDDTAFTTTFGTSCMTVTKRVAGGLACLVNLLEPPPQPPDVYGAWKGGWVDYDGSGVRVGSAHGDPERFSAGQGPRLPAGESLSFGDFRCRADSTALVCANYAHQTAVRYSDDGIEAFGCTRQEPPQPGFGIQYTCH